MTSLLQVNDGFCDATDILQQQFDQGGTIEIPQGRYRITRTLKIHSHTTVRAHRNARIFLCGDTPKKTGDFLLTNVDHENGNEDIHIFGGVWDGNNQGRYNTKGDIFDLTGYSGAVLNFYRVRHLTLRGLIVANSVTYNVRMARLEDFVIEDIGFLSDQPAFNQDGLHFNGWCRNGKVKNIAALSKGQTKDDLIALNADDSMMRVENVGMERGDIENITFENLFAEECHTIIRMLSVDHAIRNITFENVYGGYRCYAINADAARYCKTPLFKEEEKPNGVGCIENISINNMICFTNSPKTAIALESNADNIQIKNFRFLKTGAEQPPALEAKNLCGVRFITENGTWLAKQKSDKILMDTIRDLTIVKENEKIME